MRCTGTMLTPKGATRGVAPVCWIESDGVLLESFAGATKCEKAFRIQIGKHED